MRPKVKEAGAGRVRHPSETQDIMDKWMAGAVEIAAGDLRDQLDDGATNPVWTMRGNTQVNLRLAREQDYCVSGNSYCESDPFCHLNTRFWI